MWLESEVGVGSTFGFSLAGPSRSRRAPPTRWRSATPVEVVVIEDDRPSLDLFSAYLSGATIKVIDGARRPDRARSRAQGAVRDAVLLDIRLPGIDGWAVLQALKQDPETRDIPVIVVSIVEERARGAALGAAQYLVKPVGREQLLEALRAVGARCQPWTCPTGQR